MNKIALITGGSRGLGKSAALALARAGTDSVITYQRSAEAATGVVSQIEALGARCLALPLDTMDTASFPDFAGKLATALQETWGGQQFDFLVNNAGFGVHEPYASTSEADFDALVKVHLKGPFFLTQTLLPLLRDGGRILNTGSGLTRFTVPGYAAYAAMKGAIDVLTRYQAKELGARGIRVNTLAPGAIATDFGDGAVRDNPDINAMLAGNTALGRVGEADDIGGMVVALLGENTAWVTGARVEASGGMFL